MNFLRKPPSITKLSSLASVQEREGTSRLSQKPPLKDLGDMRLLITSRRSEITPSLEVVLRYALENPADVAFCTATELARRNAVSTTSVLRLTRLLGFHNFRDFRELFRREIRREQGALTCDLRQQLGVEFEE